MSQWLALILDSALHSVYSCRGCRGQPATNKNRMVSDFSSIVRQLRSAMSAVVSRTDTDGSLLENFENLALELFEAQFAHNVTYRAWCESLGRTPTSVRHLNHIPSVPTSAFKEFDLSCLPLDSRTTVFHSSGTTLQKRSRHFHDAISLTVYEASLRPWFARYLLPTHRDQASELRLISLTPDVQAAPHSSLAYMIKTVEQKFFPGRAVFAGRVESGNWELDWERLIPALDVAGRLAQPVCLAGTAFSFVHLLEHLDAEQRTLSLPPGSRVMETGGYKGRSRELARGELHPLICEKLGVMRSMVVCEYGMSELSSQAYDRIAGGDNGMDADRRCFHFPPWCFARVVNPESGLEVDVNQSGVLQILDLANVYSVACIRTEDIAIRRDLGFELVGRAMQAEPRGCSLMTA